MAMLPRPLPKLDRKRKPSRAHKKPPGVFTVIHEGRVRRLGVQESRFVVAYLGEALGNVGRAARMAGYKCKDEIGFRNTGGNVLRKPHIRKLIKEMFDDEFITSDMVLHQLSQMINVHFDDFYDVVDKQPILNLEKAKQRGKLHMIESVEVTPNGYKVGLPKRTEVLKLMAKYHGLLVDRVQVEVSVDDSQMRSELAAKLEAIKQSIDMAVSVNSKMIGSEVIDVTENDDDQ